ncbi:MAG: ABC transporter permease subunit [Verrucomicrobiales bacterium]|nr:ABC transporter permease subunit [Verrucomicrobiales bacterium]
MIRRPIQHSTAIWLGLVSLLVLLGAYTWLSHRQHQTNPDDTTMPTWSQLGKGVAQMFEVNKRSGERWVVVDAQATATRFFLGMALGAGAAVVIGLLMGCFAPIEAFFQPPLSLLAQVPPTAALAVFFVLVGTGQEMYVAMIAFGVLPALAQTVYLAVKEFPEELQYKSYTLGATHIEVIGSIILSQVLPKLIDALRLVIGPAMVYLIAAEMVVGDVGFGYRIRLQSKLLNMSVVYPYLALLAGFGFGMDFALRWLQRKLCPWYEGGLR